ncbi:hypothetical protein M3196_13915 [Fictibacillus nanhaiensis]|uniref:hypothetical protein n=1 Tax=Fictibacillus nanhaiensis TaxID=742169 RepID=UPI00203EDE1D|nr:hypothetical protein [Fictibacillus nanhaiensis]MCM3732746.1 hypothetical protein [Fictibacillus nanhaiensis]
MQVVSLRSLIDAAKEGNEERELNDYLSSFICRKNYDVQSFLHNYAISNEERSFTRTSLVIDEENNNDIIGYFTLLVKEFDFSEVSGTTRKKLTNRKDADVFNSILIAQLGRSDSYKGRVSGKDILELALHNCKLIFDLSALRVVCVEYEPIPILNDFYLSNGFYFLQENPSGNILAYLRL